MSKLSAIILLALLATSCSAASRTPQTDADAMRRAAAGLEDQDSPSVISEPERLAVDDLSRRLSLPHDEIEALDVRAVEWSDGSLGCTEPTMMPGEAVTSGHIVLLAAEAAAYEYHTDAGGLVLLCEPGRIPGDTWPSESGVEPHERLAELEEAVRQKSLRGYDVRAAEVYLGTAQWLLLMEQPDRASIYLDLGEQALDDAELAGKDPLPSVRVSIPTAVPLPEGRDM